MKQTISKKITIFFAIAIFLVCIAFIAFGKYQTNRAISQIQTNQVNAINYIIELYDNDIVLQNIEKYFNKFNLILVKDKNLIQNILSNGEKQFIQNSMFGEFASIKYNNSLFLTMQNKTFLIAFEDPRIKNINDPLWIGFILIVITILSFYISILQSLLPLKKLSKNIKNFANMSAETKILKDIKNDEIGEVAHEFNNAILKIQELIQSRQLFLRTIMHELKTPIGKGRIISEMIDNENQKNKLQGVFERLELLINEFAKIEQLLSRNYSLNYQKCPFSLIFEQAIDISMIDKWEEKITLNLENDEILNVDFSLFSLAIKNLLDNALKYSSDKKAVVICDKNKICISNKGVAFSNTFEHYKQAFIRNKNEKESGMGLGLYIIDKICEMHKFKFDYNYYDETHHFYIIFNNKEQK